jgi:hypothetical protein
MISEQNGLYFFSAWLQANAALFAIVGIFTVYKLQSLENTITSAKALLQHMGGIADVDIANYAYKDSDGKEKMLESFIKSPFVHREMFFWKKAAEDILKVKQLILPAMRDTGIGMGLCGLGIMFINLLPCWGVLTLMTIVFMLEAYIIVTIIKKTKTIFAIHESSK